MSFVAMMAHHYFIVDYNGYELECGRPFRFLYIIPKGNPRFEKLLAVY